MTSDTGKITSSAAQPLKALIFGAGAIGSYIGGSLLLSGQKAVFIEQPAVAAGLRQSGLRLNLNGNEHALDAPVVADSLESALQHAPFDVAIFALKSFDTQAALDGMKPFLFSLPPVLCLQNGVENEPAIAACLGAGQVIPGTVTSAIGRRAAGDIVLERLRGIGVAAGHPLSRRLADGFNRAGLNARLYSPAPAMKWSKMITNLLANASSAILALPPSEIFANPDLYRLEIRQLREALAVMRALELPVIDLPGTPVRALAFAVQRLPLGLSRPILKKAVGGGRGGKMPSFYIDLQSGRGHTEVDYLNGAVVRYGKKTGVSTPVNDTLNQLMQALAAGRLPLTELAGQPAKLLQRITS
jgi:2-dehydropantoate 2-reductase